MAKIADLTIDPEIQLGARGIDYEIVLEYIEAIQSGSEFPPVKAISDNGILWLYDGFHRVEAHRSLRLLNIELETRPGTRTDALILAALANVLNGKPMNRAQKKEAGERLLRMTNWSQENIARELAVDPSTVSKWQSSLEISRDTIRTVTRGGTTYTMDVSNIGKDEHKLDADRLQWYRQWAADNEKLGLDEFGDPLPRSSMAVHYSSGTDEWNTPPEIIERALKVLGKIDLDPCSNSHEVPNIPAMQYYVKEDNGLRQEWHGRIYMNPPYGRGIADWVNYLHNQFEKGNVTEAIALLPARTDTEWFRRFKQYPRCFIWGRLRFSDNEVGAPFPSMVVYLGENLNRFLEAFSDIGDTYVLLSAEDTN